MHNDFLIYGLWEFERKEMIVDYPHMVSVVVQKEEEEEECLPTREVPEQAISFAVRKIRYQIFFPNITCV